MKCVLYASASSTLLISYIKRIEKEMISAVFSCVVALKSIHHDTDPLLIALFHQEHIFILNLRP